MPRLEDTWPLYKNMLLGMVAVFQIPTLAFFLARMGVVTGRFLLRHVPYAVLIAFISAAVLTPSPDPWNQIMFAAPMLAMYAVSIVIAWMAAQNRDDDEPFVRSTSRDLRLVFAATVIDHARRHRAQTPREFPRRWRG